MRARDLAVDYETVSVDSDAMDAARLMADHKLPGLLVLDEHGEPMAILPASQMIKILVPAYVLLIHKYRPRAAEASAPTGSGQSELFDCDSAEVIRQE